MGAGASSEQLAHFEGFGSRVDLHEAVAQVIFRGCAMDGVLGYSSDAWFAKMGDVRLLLLLLLLIDTDM